MAREANCIRGHKGLGTYIEDNPLKAGLVPHAQNYLWPRESDRDASAETSLGAADTSVCATSIAQDPRKRLVF